MDSGFGSGSGSQPNMRADADLAPRLLRLLQCGTSALQRPLGPGQHAGGGASGAAERRLRLRSGASDQPVESAPTTSCRSSAAGRSGAPRVSRAATVSFSVFCLFVVCLFSFLVHAVRLLSCRCDSSSAPLARAGSHAARTPELPHAAAFARAWNAERNVTIQVTTKAREAAPLPPLLLPPRPRSSRGLSGIGNYFSLFLLLFLLRGTAAAASRLLSR